MGIEGYQPNGIEVAIAMDEEASVPELADLSRSRSKIMDSFREVGMPAETVVNSSFDVKKIGGATVYEATVNGHRIEIGYISENTPDNIYEVDGMPVEDPNIQSKLLSTMKLFEKLKNLENFNTPEKSKAAVESAGNEAKIEELVGDIFK